MANFLRHPFHLVDESPWPLMCSLGGFATTTGLVKWITSGHPDLMLGGMLLLMGTAAQWWRDIVVESTFQGRHSKVVELGMRWGVILFIVSEVFFFLSFFWAFFHASLSPSDTGGSCWPPQGLYPFDWFKVPLLNTLILLSSGVSVTWAHHALMESKTGGASRGLGITVGLGAYFTLVQALEYAESSFCISDGSYGSAFFLATGFHGLHVIVGTAFLITVWARLLNQNFSSERHFGFEAAAWYWHFVDVVWLFLFVSIYWWGGGAN